MLVLTKGSTSYFLKNVSFGESLSIPSKRKGNIDTTNKSNITGEMSNFNFEVNDVLKDRKLLLDNFIYDNWGELFVIDNLMDKRRLSGVVTRYDVNVDRSDIIFKAKSKGSSGTGTPIGGPITPSVPQTIEVNYFVLIFEFVISEIVDLTKLMFKTSHPSLYTKYKDIADTLG